MPLALSRVERHLHAKHERQFEILAVLSRRVPPLRATVQAGVQGWVVEQGEGVRKWGQQLTMHGAVRLTETHES